MKLLHMTLNPKPIAPKSTEALAACVKQHISVTQNDGALIFFATFEVLQVFWGQASKRFYKCLVLLNPDSPKALNPSYIPKPQSVNPGVWV